MAEDITAFKVKLGKRIQQLRVAKYTQLELGALIDKDFQAISRLEKGRVNPSAYLVYQIAEALGVTMDEIFDFSKLQE